jgi:hypothetical protein
MVKQINISKLKVRLIIGNYFIIGDGSTTRKKYIKQAQVGKLSSQSISFQSTTCRSKLNNSSNTLRKARGTYIISEYTEPNWTVEYI